MNLYSFALLLTLLLPRPSFALSDYNGCDYVTPSQLMDSHKSLIEAEAGILTEVPLDYNNPIRGTTKIYSYFTTGFDPKRPTYVLFTGGPGQHSHLQASNKFSFYGTLGYNFLMFDQRGIAFSRLENEDLAKDARNFSSEATARDVISILNQRGISKISVYGASYGTIPATVFAHLFPERTNSLVLEGVVYDGWNGVMGGKNISGQIQKYYDSFSAEIKTRINELIESKKISEFWFPMIVRGFMMQYGSYYLPLFKEAIHEALIIRKLETDQEIGMVFGELSAKTFSSGITPEAQASALKWFKLMEHNDKCKTIADSEDLNHLLMLKEFDAGLDNVYSVFSLKGGKITPVPHSNYAPFLNDFTNMTFSSYSASDYKVKVPTFYIQGTADGATAAPGASLHFKNAAVGPAQLLFFRGSSHMPFGLAIFGMDEAELHWQELQNIFAQFLKGEPMTCDTKDRLEKTYQFIDLVSATKGFGTNFKCK
jgi:proline iminopeptidase